MTDTNNPATPPAATPGSDTLYAEYLHREAAERAAERDDLATLRPQLLALARAAGAATITARYEGGGDSGVMDEIHVEPETADATLQATSLPRPVQRWNAETRVCETILAQTPFHDCVRDMLTTLLTHRVGNWWDGGDIESSGEVVWHVGEDPDRITGEHTLTTRSSEYDEWEDPDPENDAADLHPATGA